MSVKRLMLEDCQLGRCVTLTKQVLQDQIIYAVLDGENRQLSEQEPGRSKSVSSAGPGTQTREGQAH